MLRLLHIGLGPLGIRFLDDYAQRRVARPVGVIDISPQLAGQPLRTLVKRSPFNLRILPSLEAFDDWDSVDCAVVTTASDLRACADTFRALLSRGKAVISTCEELTWPFLRHPALSRELHALALAHGGRLLGTGVNPGYLMDALPVFATTVCRSVKTIEIHRIQDATTRRIPFQKKIGATLDFRDFKQGIKAGWLRHVGLGESLHFVAAAMGWRIDRWNETIEPVRAPRAMRCGLGPIPKGCAAGVRQVASGYSGGKRVLRFIFQAAIGQKDPHDRVIVAGDPPLDLTFKGGVHGDIATSSITINAIPSLLAAPPGLHTMMSVPLTHYAPAS
jgi:4-hydroxy-tetrahydrodipicolinate reductase